MMQNTKEKLIAQYYNNIIIHNIDIRNCVHILKMDPNALDKDTQVLMIGNWT